MNVKGVIKYEGEIYVEIKEYVSVILIDIVVICYLI